MPLLAAYGARFYPEELHTTMNSKVHLFWHFGKCFPMCRILLPLTQIWLNSATLSRDTFSSWLNFQAPNLRAQAKGAGVCLPAREEYQTCASRFLSASAVPGVDRSFLLTSADKGLIKDNFSTHLIKSLSFPHSNLPCCYPAISFTAQWSILAFARLQHFCWECSCSCSPTTNGKQISTPKVTAFLETLSEVCCSIRNRPSFGDVPSIFKYLGSDSTIQQGMDCLWASWPGTSQTNTFQNVCFHSTEHLRARSEYFRLKKEVWSWTLC